MEGPYVGDGAFGEDEEIVERAHALRVQLLPHWVTLEEHAEEVHHTAHAVIGDNPLARVCHLRWCLPCHGVHEVLVRHINPRKN